MARIHVHRLVVIAALLGFAASAAAQNWGTTPRDGACFYEDANYRGRYFCVESGQEFEELPRGANDEVSSIRIFGDAEVTIYERTQFRGQSRQVRRNVENLSKEDFNDRVSSVRVRRLSLGGTQNPERIVRRAYQDILQRDPDSDGMRIYRSHIIDDGWTEQQVREALRNSEEYRRKNTMTREKAQEIVRRAYLAVLKRGPDAASAGYVERVFRDKWTQADVERELRKSPEYRGR